MKTRKIPSFDLGYQRSRALSLALFFGLFLFAHLVFGQAPTITSFSPTSAEVGATVTITGTGFDATAGNNIVYFGSSKATVISASTTQLNVTLPTAASTGTLLQVVNKVTATSAFKKYSLPFIYDGVSAVNPIQPLFTTQNTTATGPTLSLEGTSYQVMGQKMCSGDFNNDGKIDYVSLGIQSNKVLRIFTNVGTNDANISSSTFTTSNFTLTNNHFAISHHSVDINNDGLLDLVIGGLNYLAILINTTQGQTISFNEILINTPSTSNARIKFADIDNDGWMDIITVGNQNKVNIIKISGYTAPNTISSSIHSITLGSNVLDFDLADFNNDNKIDIVVQRSGMAISLLLNNSSTGSVAFNTPNDIITGVNSGNFPHWGGILSADFDNDGDIDIVYSVTGSASPFIRMMRNDAGTFSSPFSIGNFTGSSNMPSSLRVFDFNGDGKLDVAVTGGSNSGGLRAILNNYSTGQLSSSDFTNVSTIYGSEVIGAVIEDFNQNGRIDIIHNQYYNANLSYYTNRPVPSINVVHSLVPFTQCGATPSASQTFTVSGNNLTANISIGALTNYEYSLDDVTFSSTISIPHVSGTVAPTTVYVRYNRTTNGTNGGNITLSSTGATSQTVAVTGTRIDAPSISGPLLVYIGQTVSLTGSGTPDANTPWVSSDPTVASVDNNGVVTGLTAGTVSITFTNDVGCSVSVSLISSVFVTPPSITSLSTLRGEIGSQLIINGSNFNTTASDNSVYFGGTKATVTAATSTSLTVNVPKTDIYSKVYVVSNGVQSNAIDFHLTQYTSGTLNNTWWSNYFKSPTTQAIGFNPSMDGILVADVNNDGNNDIIIPSSSSGIVKMFINNGTSNLSNYNTVSLTTPDSPPAGSKSPFIVPIKKESDIRVVNPLATKDPWVCISYLSILVK